MTASRARIKLLPRTPLQVSARPGGAGLALKPYTRALDVYFATLLRGPKGDRGDSATRYVHTQTTAAPVWTVPHNLHARPAVTVVDHLGRQVFPDVAWIDDDIVQITHGAAMTGAVYCS